uniref:Uncharacterized protein n=1 Tax=Glossina brevipalpis TaxID=37001 RepID=A0A1A9WZR0_9MUSC
MFVVFVLTVRVAPLNMTIIIFTKNIGPLVLPAVTTEPVAVPLLALLASPALLALFAWLLFAIFGFSADGAAAAVGVAEPLPSAVAAEPLLLLIVFVLLAATFCAVTVVAVPGAVTTAAAVDDGGCGVPIFSLLIPQPLHAQLSSNEISRDPENDPINTKEFMFSFPALRYEKI